MDASNKTRSMDVRLGVPYQATREEWSRLVAKQAEKDLGQSPSEERMMPPVSERIWHVWKVGDKARLVVRIHGKTFFEVTQQGTVLLKPDAAAPCLDRGMLRAAMLA